MTSSDQTSPDDDYDQDSEATMTAPVEGRPTGIEDDSVAETQTDISSPDADDQSGSEEPSA